MTILVNISEVYMPETKFDHKFVLRYKVYKSKNSIKGDCLLHNKNKGREEIGNKTLIS